MVEKLDGLQSIGVDTVHIGICTVQHNGHQNLCPNIEKIMELLHERGIRTVEGTH